LITSPLDIDVMGTNFPQQRSPDGQFDVSMHWITRLLQLPRTTHVGVTGEAMSSMQHSWVAALHVSVPHVRVPLPPGAASADASIDASCWEAPSFVVASDPPASPAVPEVVLLLQPMSRTAHAT
jgi:hypothetical protein